jgi:hypothetical protein
MSRRRRTRQAAPPIGARTTVAGASNNRNNRRMNRVDYLWQLPDWPNGRYDLAALTAPLTAVSHAQGRLLGRLADVGFDPRLKVTSLRPVRGT